MAWNRQGEPTHRIAHLSDTHLVADGLLYGAVDTNARLRSALERLRERGEPLDAIVVTGDLADRGEPEAYRALRALVEPAADELGARIVWVMGNHDERDAFRRELRSDPQATGPVVEAVDVRGLRIVALDSSVPGWHHGELDDGQLDWLEDVLAEPAEHGTLLAVHHAPVPTPVALMQLLDLDGAERLAAIIRAGDVRGILAGHLHYSTSGMLGGVPVLVAPAIAYTIDLGAPRRELAGVDTGQGFDLVHVHPEQLVRSSVPIVSAPPVTRFGADFLGRLEALPPDEQRAAFSRQPQTA